jgi:hypothetical protein
MQHTACIADVSENISIRFINASLGLHGQNFLEHVWREEAD